LGWCLIPRFRFAGGDDAAPTPLKAGQIMSIIEISSDSSLVGQGVSAILVPEIALTEPGYIKTMAVNMTASTKHEFFALAQMAYYQYQDGELAISEVAGPLTVRWSGETETLEHGVLIYRDEAGKLHVLSHGLLSQKKMLEAANRYCTRWVRLDI
jgi:hypothetical protein